MGGMPIGEIMILSRKVPIVVLVILLQVLVLRESNGCQGFFLASADSTMQTIVDEHLMEKILFDCGVKKEDVGKLLRSLDNSILRDLIQNLSETHLGRVEFSKDRPDEAISLLPQEIKERLLDALSKHNIPLVTGKRKHLKGGQHLNLECLLGWIHSSRRYLVNEPSETAASALSRRSANSPSPSYASTSSSGMFSRLLSDKEATEIDLSEEEDEDDSSDSGLLVTAVGASILGTLLVLAVFFILYKKCHDNRSYSLYNTRDDRPLLSLSMSDFPGSPPHPFGLSNTFEKSDIISSLSTEPLQDQHHSALNVNSTEGTAAEFLSTSMGPSTEQFEKPTKVMAPKPPPPPPPPIMAPPVPRPPPPPPVPKAAPRTPAPPPPPLNKKPGAPPAPPKTVLPPRTANMKSSKAPRPSSSGLKQSNNNDDEKADNDAPKAKLKPFFWDKVAASPNHSMVWDRLQAGSFQFNEDMIENLFGYVPANKPKNEDKMASSKNTPQLIRILEPKKSQNLAISLKALNVKSDVACHVLMEGGQLPVELLQTLLKMPPTTDEELKLRLYNGNISELGPAEQFLKVLVEIPSAYPKLDALLLMASLTEEFSCTKESFATVKVACEQLKNSRLFLKLLEAVLKTGNRMNVGTYRGGAQAFKLDTLLKLADVKGTDGKTSLLHFVVQEIIRSEGLRAVRVAKEQNKSISDMISHDFSGDPNDDYNDYLRKIGLKVVSGLGNELENVKKAAGLDADALTSTVASLESRLSKTKEFLNKSMENLDEESGFHRSLKLFVEQAEPDVAFLLEEEKLIRSMVQKTTDFFHGKEGKDEGLRLFVIVRSFLGMLDKTCKQVSEAPKRVTKAPRSKDEPSPSASPARDPRELLFPAIKDRRVESSSSDDDDDDDES